MNRWVQSGDQVIVIICAFAIFMGMSALWIRLYEFLRWGSYTVSLDCLHQQALTQVHYYVGEYAAAMYEVWFNDYKMIRRLQNLVVDGHFALKGERVHRKHVDAVVGEIVTYFEKVVQLRNDEFARNGMGVQDFLYQRSLRKGDAVGVYILFNRNKDMYYVGQSKRIYFRVNQHFTGHGNGDVYADYKYGDEFTIKLLPLVDSGYSDIDALERDKIAEFSANDTGYNRTRGNR